MKPKAKNELQILLKHYPELSEETDTILGAFEIMKECFMHGGKLYLCGNGGSSADCEHMVGELMKSFKKSRPLPSGEKDKLEKLYGEDGKTLSEKLECALPAISLVGQTAFLSAYSNDIDYTYAFAQEVYGYGCDGDLLAVFSTSGNSANIIAAVQVANAKGMKTIGLTGKFGGKLKDLCTICICVPEDETYRIQELHLPIYHTLCAMLEVEFFTDDGYR